MLLRLFPIVEIQLKNIYVEQLFFFNLMIFLRSFIIAVRYGFASEFRMKMLTSRNQDFEFISSDLLLPIWMNFNPQGLQIEIEATMWRN